MKRFSVSGTNHRLLKKARYMAKRAGFSYSTDADFIIAIGGHGTFYYAEKKFPETPKLIVRNENMNNLPEALKRLKNEKYDLREMIKLDAQSRNHKIQAVNDITIRNADIKHALRFELSAGRHLGNIISDGIVVSTPYGSSGYFYSICKKKFKEGMGIVVNNPTVPIKPVIKKSMKVTMKIEREAAEMVADSASSVVQISEGKRITIKKSKNKTQLIKIKGSDLFRRHSTWKWR